MLKQAARGGTRCRRILIAVGWMALSPAGAFATEIHGHVVDAATGTPLPCRLYVEGPPGEFHFAKSADPAGSAVVYDVARSATSVERHVTLSAHPFVVDLPNGKYTLTAEHGKEWTGDPVSIEVVGEPIDVEIPLTRWIEMPSRGYYSGDTHVHRKLEEMDNLVLAEDLNVALPLTNWVRSAHVAPTEGELKTPVEPGLTVVDPTHVYWTMNTEYELFNVNGKPHTLGAVFVLNHQTPLTLGAPPVVPVAEEARRQGALLDLDKHTWPWSVMAAFAMDVDLFELANNHVWRTEFLFKTWTLEALPDDWDIETDDVGFTEWGWVDFGFKTYYAFLNCGLPMRPTGGTGSGVHPVPLGYGRVYVHVDGPFSYEKWIAGLAAGNSFVTTGPMLDVRFNRRLPGTRFAANETFEFEMEGTAEGLQPLESLELIVNGEVRPLPVKNDPRPEGGFLNRFTVKEPVDSTSWAAVRCLERLPNGRFRYAHTAPAHVDVPSRPLAPRKREIGYFIARLDEELRRNTGVLSDAELAEYRRVRARLQEQFRFSDLRD
jgi:hypothetical protein